MTFALVDPERLGGGIGCGPPTKLYKHVDLLKVCLQKYGRAELRKKLEARYKRKAKKRIREEEAHEALRTSPKETNDECQWWRCYYCCCPSFISEGYGRDQKASNESLANGQEANGLSNEWIAQNWRFEIPGMTAATFAALMCRPTNVDLATFVKKGVYYTEEKWDVHEFFEVSEEDPNHKVCKGFRREGVSPKMCSGITVRFKPSSNDMSVTGWAEMVCV